MKTNDFYIVGIGASAGGLQALEQFFSALPDQPGMAFIIVVHIPRDKPSQLYKILQSLTRMPVKKVTQPVLLLKDHVYVIAENTYLEAKGDSLRIKEREPGGANRAVDILFKSLATELKNRVIGVVLSGTGRDGLEGVKVIEDNRGFVLVQHPDSAQFDGMPMSIVNFDHPDVIDTPQRLAQFIVDYVNSFTNSNK